MQQICTTIFLALLLSSCAKSQKAQEERLVGAPCDGCEAVFNYGERKIKSTDTLVDFKQKGTQIKIEGTVYQPDETTPAQGVIMYIYHTNQDGVYEPSSNAEGWENQHGVIRTWLRTDENGRYSFYTLKPAPYPSGKEPAHIHYTILEPNGKYYYITSVHFSGDELLSEKELNPPAPRGGNSGVVTLKKEGNIMVGVRDVVLGKNIPNYE